MPQRTDAPAAPRKTCRASRGTDRLCTARAAEYRRCDTGEDLEDIYRLRYKAYMRSGMCWARNAATAWSTIASTNLPNSYRFGIYIDGQLVSTLRLHHISAGTRCRRRSSAYPGHVDAAR